MIYRNKNWRCRVTAGSVGESVWKGRDNPSGSKSGEHNSPGRVVPARSRTVILFCAKLCLVCLAVAVASGCGRYKEELENAKQQIDRLSAENKKLTEVAANLEKEKNRVSDELKLFSDRTSKMQKEMDEAKRAKAAVSEENAELKKRNSAIQEDLTSLRREKADLQRKVEELNKPAAESVQPGKRPEAGFAEMPQQPGAGKQVSKPQGKMTPCDAVIEFMKKSGEIVRQQKGEERTKSLQQVRQQYASRMRGAPAKAVKAAEVWVNELSSSWDNPKGDTVLSLLIKRNAALEACNKKPEDAGF